MIEEYLKDCETKEEKSKKLDQISTIYNTGVIEGMKHQKSSPETLKHLETMSNNMQNIETHLEYIKGTLEENKDEHKEIFEYLKSLQEKNDLLQEKNDSKYARISDVQRLEEIIEKQEVLVNKVLWTSVTSLIGFLVMIIIQLLNHVL